MPDHPCYRACVEATEPEIINTPAENTRKLARIGDRVFALILDTIALLPIYFLAGCVLGVWFGTYANGAFSLNGGPFFLYLLVLTILWVVYYMVCEVSFRATIGKAIVGIEIGSAESYPYAAEQAVRRNLMRPIDAIGFYLLGFLMAVSSKRHQTIGDRVAGTAVYEKESPDRRRAIWIGVAFFIGGVLLNAIFQHYAVPINQ
jgi:uncharacterized RDD family membrane protein YckC